MQLGSAPQLPSQSALQLLPWIVQGAPSWPVALPPSDLGPDPFPAAPVAALPQTLLAHMRPELHVPLG